MTYRYTAVQKVEPTVYVLRYEMTVIGKSRWLLVCLLTLASCAGVVAALRYKSLSQHSSVRRLEALGVTFSLDKKAAPQTSWSRVVFGDRRFDFIKRMKVQGGSLSNRDASRISDFPRLRDVFIEECPDTDAIFGATARVTTIEYVHLHNSKVTQYGIQKLSDIRQLKDDVPASVESWMKEMAAPLPGLGEDRAAFFTRFTEPPSWGKRIRLLIRRPS